jgi:hypothetical protein
MLPVVVSLLSCRFIHNTAISWFTCHSACQYDFWCNVDVFSFIILRWELALITLWMRVCFVAQTALHVVPSRKISLLLQRCRIRFWIFVSRLTISKSLLKIYHTWLPLYIYLRLMFGLSDLNSVQLLRKQMDTMTTANANICSSASVADFFSHRKPVLLSIAAFHWIDRCSRKINN